MRQGLVTMAGNSRSDRGSNSDRSRNNDSRGSARGGSSRGNSGSGQGSRSGGGYQGRRDGDGRASREGGKPGGERGDSRGTRSGGGYQGRRDDRPERSAEQQVYDGPPIPDDVSSKDLDKFARAELQNIPEKLAEKVARHLVMAGTLLHEDPDLAHKHALAARARAMRNGLVREAVGETAYARGSWAEALSEFRAARRMNGRNTYVPMMADCERALGRPEKALEFDRAEVRNKLDEMGNIELTIVLAGARRDLGQVEAALQMLETEPLNSKSRADWLPRLRYAYADTLLAAGRKAEAIEWFHRVVAVDPEQVTDADERLAALEK
ncbi:MAG: tetratricopeptide repeat protein [Aeromicrobium sp.]|nr:MAG: tetratricopeptide repeat protein [Aeromicrobium sp.]